MICWRNWWLSGLAVCRWWWCRWRRCRRCYVNINTASMVHTLLSKHCILHGSDFTCWHYFRTRLAVLLVPLSLALITIQMSRDCSPLPSPPAASSMHQHWHTEASTGVSLVYLRVCYQRRRAVVGIFYTVGGCREMRGWDDELEWGRILASA